MSPALKYWDGSAWQTLAGTPGAMGPPAAPPIIICQMQAQGVLPRTINFTMPQAVTNGLLFVSMSGYPAAAGLFALGYFLSAGSQPAAQAKEYGNTVAHMTLPLAMCPVTNVPAGPCALGIRNDLNANMDPNDFVTAWIQPLDGPVLNIVPNIPLVTSLPTAPVDGQEVYYLADATNGVIWHLRYRAASSSAYKWEVLGGTPLTAASDVAQGTAGPLWYTTPTLTLPLAGDYLLGFELEAYGGPSTANLQVQWAFVLGDGTTNYGGGFMMRDFFMQGNPAGGAIWAAHPHFGPRLKTGLAAGTVLKIRADTVVNWDASSDHRMINAMPVRVG